MFLSRTISRRNATNWTGSSPRVRQTRPAWRWSPSCWAWRRPRVTTDPAARRTLLVQAVARLVAEPAQETLTLIVVEDAQWIDPTSRALLSNLSQWAQGAPAVVAVTVRGNSLADIDDLLASLDLVETDGRYPDHVTVHEVRELDTISGKRLAVAVAESEGLTLDAGQLDAIVARSAGLPLYLKQLVKALASGFDPGTRLEGRIAAARPSHSMTR
jgi:hypothetical protein